MEPAISGTVTATILSVYVVWNWKAYEVSFINCHFLNLSRDETNKEEDEEEEEVEEEEEE